jgi:NAD(P)-dependent dehydrogenase (short-subunit alcohol dehydrogenase family)
MQVGGKRVTEDNMEATCQVNYLANFLLVLLLLPMMRRDCRIICLTSNLILDEGDFRGARVAKFDEFATKLPDPVVQEMGRGKAFSEGTARYAISKVLLSMFAAELQRRLDTSNEFGGISVVLLDPGTFVSGMLNGRSWMYPNLTWHVVKLLTVYRIPARRPNGCDLCRSTPRLSSVFVQETDQDQLHQRQPSRRKCAEVGS